MESARKLPISAVLFGILAAAVGGVVGAFAGGAIGSLLASAMHVPSREGEAGYFVVFIALIGMVVATPATVILTLYWRGVRSVWLLFGTIFSIGAILVVIAAGFGIWYAAQPHYLNLNGPTPRLEFEIKPPQGVSVQALADARAELDTDRNVMPGDWNSDSKNEDVRAGAVDLAFRTSKRLFVLKFSNGEDQTFNLKLPANPMNPQYREWSEWKNPDFKAKPGEQPTRSTATSGYQIRYRVDYQ
jgi:MFS family permease